MDMKIRRAGKKDFKAIMNLEIKWEKEGISWGVKHPSKKELMKHITEDLVYVTEEGGKLIGYAIAKISKAEETCDWAGIEKGEKFGWIDGVYVGKRYRNKGIGVKLMKKLMNDLKKEKIKTVKLKAVNKDLRKIERFYEKFGFKSKMSDMVKKLR
jgi:N-acetylglutamate synthase-like GNAT family acetyltransferase